MVGVDFPVVFHMHVLTSWLECAGTSQMSKLAECTIAVLGWSNGGIGVACFSKWGGSPASRPLLTHGSCRRHMKFRWVISFMLRVAVAVLECCMFICRMLIMSFDGFDLVLVPFLAAPLDWVFALIVPGGIF